MQFPIGWKVLICDPIDQSLIKAVQEKGFTVSYLPEIQEKELSEIIEDYEVVIVRSRTRLTGDVMSRALNLQVIARAGVGTDNSDVKYASRKGIRVVTAAGSSTHSVAELSVGLAISLSRSIPMHYLNSKQDSVKKTTGYELYGKSAGLVGFGRIGVATAKILRAMGMRIIAYDPIRNTELMSEVEGKYVELDTLFQESDYIFVLATLTEESKNMIGGRLLDKIKPKTFLINTSRSELINGPDLLFALQKGNLGGYASDLYWHEPPIDPWERELISMPNVIITPHIGAQTEEAQKRVAEYTLNNLLSEIEVLQH